MGRRVVIGLVVLLTVSMVFFFKPRTGQPPAVSQDDLMPVVDLPPLADEEAKNLLLTHTKRMADASVSQNHELLTDLTHPAQIRVLGGRAAVIAQHRASAEKVAAEGWRITSAECGEPSGFVSANGRLYAVIPMQSLIVSDLGERVVNRTHLLGVSADGGRSWRFLAFSEGQVTRDQVKTFVPDLPDSIDLPKTSQPILADPDEK